MAHGVFIRTPSQQVQPDDQQPQQQSQQTDSEIVRAFFVWFFTLSHCGSLFAIGILAYVQVMKDVYMRTATWIAVGFLGLAFVIFCAGGLWYSSSCETTSRRSFLDCLRAACYSCHRRGGYEEIEVHVSPTASIQNAREQVAAAEAEQQRQQEAEQATGKKRFWYLFIISLVLIPYWVIHHQMLTTYPFQAVHMNLEVDNFPIPVSWMYLTEAILLFIMIPVIYGWILPYFEARNYFMSMRRRVAVGIVFAILSALAAGVLEYHRRNRFWEEGGSMEVKKYDNTVYYAANMTVLYQIPQYVLMGVGEAFSNVAGLELVYSLTPTTMRGIALGIFWLFSGIGSFLTCAISAIGYKLWFFDWDNGDPNCRLKCPDTPLDPGFCHECKVEIFFFIQAGLAAGCLVVFLILTKRLQIGYDQ